MTKGVHIVIFLIQSERTSNEIIPREFSLTAYDFLYIDYFDKEGYAYNVTI